MAKVAIKSGKITSFGGIFHVVDVFPNLNSIKSLTPRLVSVAVQGTAFQYSDIISSLFYSNSSLKFEYMATQP